MSRGASASGFLAEMAAASRARVRRLTPGPRRAALARAASSAPPPPPLRLPVGGFELLAEVKFASPSAGRLAQAAEAEHAARQARRYAAAGAAALSVLTEPTRFAGALTHLGAAARAVRVPVMRKDFLVDPLQVLEARAAGASGVLLVLRMLAEDALAALLDAAEEHGLFVLLEAFDEADLERAARVLATRSRGTYLVGVNARDLATLAVDPHRHLALAERLPRGVPCVAESGLTTAADARAAVQAGYGLALVGSALMRATDPGALLAEMLAAGRAAAAERRAAP